MPATGTATPDATSVHPDEHHPLVFRDDIHRYVVQSPYLTRREAAQYARCHVATVDRAIRAGELRALGANQLLRIKPAWIEQWLQSRRDAWLERRDR